MRHITLLVAALYIINSGVWHH